eukprot:2874036-Alexandrium_andersonii.AAC.1
MPWCAGLWRAGRPSRGRTRGSSPPAWRASPGRSRRRGRCHWRGRLGLRLDLRWPNPRRSSLCRRGRSPRWATARLSSSRRRLIRRRPSLSS